MTKHAGTSSNDVATSLLATTTNAAVATNEPHQAQMTFVVVWALSKYFLMFISYY